MRRQGIEPRTYGLRGPPEQAPNVSPPSRPTPPKRPHVAEYYAGLPSQASHQTNTNTRALLGTPTSEPVQKPVQLSADSPGPRTDHGSVGRGTEPPCCACCYAGPEDTRYRYPYRFKPLSALFTPRSPALASIHSTLPRPFHARPRAFPLAGPAPPRWPRSLAEGDPSRAGTRHTQNPFTGWNLWGREPVLDWNP